MNVAPPEGECLRSGSSGGSCFFSLCVRLLPGETRGSDQPRASLFSAAARQRHTSLREMLFWGVSTRRIRCRWMEVATPQQVLAISVVSPDFLGHFR